MRRTTARALLLAGAALMAHAEAHGHTPEVMAPAQASGHTPGRMAHAEASGHTPERMAHAEASGHTAERTVWARPQHDPAFVEGGAYAELLKRDGEKPLETIRKVPNTGQIKGYYAHRPAPAHVFEVERPVLRFEDRPRRVALLVLDMQREYAEYVDYVLPNAHKLLAACRAARLPVFWTNWAHRADDGFYSGTDRLLGGVGVSRRQNFNFVYSADGSRTLDSLAPRTDEERGREIMSLHANKFADRDATGEPILPRMLGSLGIDTVIIIGAWTDFCVAATALAAVDTWGLDVVTVRDAVASAVSTSPATLDLLNIFSMLMNTSALVDMIEHRPELFAPPLPPQPRAASALEAAAAMYASAVREAEQTPTAASVLVLSALLLGVAMGMLGMLALLRPKLRAHGGGSFAEETMRAPMHAKQLAEGSMRAPVHAKHAAHPSELTEELTLRR